MYFQEWREFSGESASNPTGPERDSRFAQNGLDIFIPLVFLCASANRMQSSSFAHKYAERKSLWLFGWCKDFAVLFLFNLIKHSLTANI